MNTLDILLEKIWQMPDCFVYTPAGMPTIQPDHVLPDDLNYFYQLCGGLELFKSSSFPTIICPPDRLIPANPVIFAGISQDLIDETKGHPSWSWYIVCECPEETDQWITIDLSSLRAGYCYDSQFFLHPGDSYIVASSFTELLALLIVDKGEDRFWFNFPPDRREPTLKS